MHQQPAERSPDRDFMVQSTLLELSLMTPSAYRRYSDSGSNLRRQVFVTSCFARFWTLGIQVESDRWSGMRHQVLGEALWCEALFCEIEIEAAPRDEISNLFKSYDSSLKIALNVIL